MRHLLLSLAASSFLLTATFTTQAATGREDPGFWVKQIEDQLKKNAKSKDKVGEVDLGYYKGGLSSEDVDALAKAFGQLKGKAKEIRKLRLSGNKIRGLPDGFGAELANMEILYLNKNELATLPDKVFS